MTIFDWEYCTNIGYQHDPAGFGIWHSRFSQSANKHQALTDEGWTDVAAGAYRPPTILMRDGVEERMMDRLWAEGVRPTKWGHEGEVRALRDHLESEREMRIVLLDNVMKRANEAAKEQHG